jgi:hypothetical protein
VHLRHDQVRHPLVWPDAPRSRLRPEMNHGDSARWSEEHELRLRAMATAMANLEREGLFGRGAGRLLAAVDTIVSWIAPPSDAPIVK